MAMRLDTATPAKKSVTPYRPGWSPAGSTVYGPYSPASIAAAARTGVTVTPVRYSTVPTYSGSGAKATAPAAAKAATGQTAAKAATGQTAAQRAAASAAASASAAANNAARASATTDLERLNAQITAKSAQKLTNQNSLDALKKLVEGGLQGSRDTQLKAIDDSLKVKMAQIQTAFDTSLGDFHGNLRENEATEGDASFANLANATREKGDLVTQALSQGAGESDVLKSQLQALRNWSANQGDIARSFFDTRTSVNSAITDLNNATKTSRINEETSANSSRGGIWDDFYGAQADAFTQMSNLDQQNYLLSGEIQSAESAKGTSSGLLAWLDSGKSADTYVASPNNAQKAAAPPAYTSDYAQKAADAAGSSWTSPGVSKETEEFKGGELATGSLNSSQVWNGQDNTPSKKKPEGSTLRKW